MIFQSPISFKSFKYKKHSLYLYMKDWWNFINVLNVAYLIGHCIQERELDCYYKKLT